MKQIFGFGAAALVLVATLTAADAQSRNAPPPSPYKWCLQEYSGGPGGGSLPELCRFVTLQQCQASRSSAADRCVQNNTGQRS